MVFIFAVDVLILVSYRELSIVMTDEKIKFGFGRFKKLFYIKKIKNIEIKDYKFTTYRGYGIRIGRDGSVGYVPRGGKGLMLTVEGEKRPYFFNTNNPDQLKNLLLRYGAKES